MLNTNCAFSSRPELDAAPTGQEFHQAAFLARWQGSVRHDLSASHAQTLSLSALLALATDAEHRQWAELSLDYSTPDGSFALRALIAARHDQLNAENIVCCAGAQEALAAVARALLLPGDHAIVVLPIYQPAEWAVTDRAHATGVPLEPGSFTLDIDRLAAAIRPETRLILTNFPNSPTGAVLDRATQAALIALCRRHGLWLINDEVYRQTVTDAAQPAPAVADVYERGVSINALSKGFGLPGCRVGWVACRDHALLAQVGIAKAGLSGGLSAPSELLARVALREERLLTTRARAIATINRYCLDQLCADYPDMFESDPPRSLAIAFPRYLGPEGAAAFAAFLAEQAGVLVLPGSLWRSPLGSMADDRLRISLGHRGVPAALGAIDAVLKARRAR